MTSSYRSFCFSILFLGGTSIVCGQSNYRPKIAELGIERLTDYRTKAVGEGSKNASTEVERDLLMKAKIAIPIIIRKDKAFGLQLKHYQHRFLFDHEDDTGSQELFDYLGNSRFYSTGIRAFYQQNISDFGSLRFIGGIEINSDQFVLNRNSGKYFISASYQVKKSSTEKVGYGFVASHSLGRFAALPIFSYENHFSPRWVLSLVLPKSASIRYILDKRTYLTSKVEFKGWRYNLTEALPFENNDLTLRKTDIQLNLAFEREIHDWLWFGLEAGYNKNLQYFLVEPGGAQKDAIVNFSPRDAGYLKASIFVVPPRKLFGR